MLDKFTSHSIEHVYKEIKRYIRKTPVERSDYYSNLSGAEVFLKYENQQITGSFKVRGALNKVFSIPDHEIDKGLIAVSAGNHALGYGYALKKKGKRGIIILPENASKAKVLSLKQYPVDIEFHGKNYDEAENYTLDVVAKTGKIFVSPYNDPYVIAGQSTVAFEAFTEIRDAEVLLVPVGGGGLLAGACLFKEKFNLDIEIYGVQTEESPTFKAAFDAGEITHIPIKNSIAEGLHGQIQEGSITFPLVAKGVKDILLVSDKELKDQFYNFIQYHHTLVETSSIVTVAAIVKYSELFKGKKVMGILTGSNIDAGVLANILKEHKPNL